MNFSLNMPLVAVSLALAAPALAETRQIYLDNTLSPDINPLTIRAGDTVVFSFDAGEFTSIDVTGDGFSLWLTHQNLQQSTRFPNAGTYSYRLSAENPPPGLEPGSGTIIVQP